MDGIKAQNSRHMQAGREAPARSIVCSRPLAALIEESLAQFRETRLALVG